MSETARTSQATRQIERLLKSAMEERDRLAIVVTGLEYALEYSIEQDGKVEREFSPAGSMRNAMYDKLAEAGEPLHYRELYRRLTADGVQISGSDPIRNLGAHLSNDERFKRQGEGKWGLAAWSDPERITPMHARTVRVDGQQSA